ncbi:MULTISPECIES: DUF2635 domain-containing protein [Vibrio]|uniref:DUF2635 domain-containing protein n=1 Tax=Vibrio TaxID=662 RepID=UPI000B5C80EF|nr:MULTISPECIES: DUF2635 domain-containing protein [Vibrio]HBV77660.1 DUF2635 domain-containing protein [Vibrio sp.]
MREMMIKPKGELLVRDPETRVPLKKQGETKPRNSYWLRRIQDGSCELIAKQPTETVTTVKAETKKDNA